jgi:nucleoside-diphosphate-sugar epimerase
LIELTDVRDAAEAILCAEAEIASVHGRAVNVSGGHPLSVREVALALAASLGYAPELTRVPLSLAWVAAVAAELTASGGRRPEPILTRYTLATLACSQTFDMEETARLIGFHPRHDGLAALLSAAASLKR